MGAITKYELKTGRKMLCKVKKELKMLREVYNKLLNSYYGANVKEWRMDVE